MHPLRDLHGAEFDLAPLSVLIDGKQVRTLARLRAEVGTKGDSPHLPERPEGCSAQMGTVPFFPDNVLYIYEKQLEEADLIVLNKTDRLTAAGRAELESSLAERFPKKPVMAISALTGDGVDAWLDYVLHAGPATPHVVAVDYDTYAAGEAALGWLNASIALQAAGPVNWRMFAEELLTEIRDTLVARSAEIAHLKLVLRRWTNLAGQRDGKLWPRIARWPPQGSGGGRDAAIERPRPYRARRAQCNMQGCRSGGRIGQRADLANHGAAEPQPRPARADASVYESYKSRFATERTDRRKRIAK